MNIFKFFSTLIIVLFLLSSFIIAQDTTLAITASGNVGIGTTNPEVDLEVVSKTIGGGIMTYGDAGSSSSGHYSPAFHLKGINIDDTDAFGALGLSLSDGHFSSSASRGDLVLKVNGDDILFNTNSSAAKMTIKSDGKVGIGTTTPSTNLEVAGDTHVSGKITSGTAQVSLPIAYGAINTDGSVISATSNVTSTWNESLNRYEISITGESYIAWNYATSVTVIEGVPLTVSTGSISGKLTVYIFDQNGNKIQSRFHFVVHKP